MRYPAYKIRIIARASITRYDAGDGAIGDIVGSYNLGDGNEESVLAQIAAIRSDIPLPEAPAQP